MSKNMKLIYFHLLCKNSCFIFGVLLSEEENSPYFGGSYPVNNRGTWRKISICCTISKVKKRMGLCRDWQKSIARKTLAVQVMLKFDWHPIMIPWIL